MAFGKASIGEEAARAQAVSPKLDDIAEAASDIFDSWTTIAIFAVPIALVGGLVGAIAAMRWRR